MSEVDVVPITADEARILTDAIKSALVATWNLREQAYKSRVWVPLGYSSWETYCEAEFSTVAIPRAERQSVVAAMRSAGMSTRAIAAATGLGVGTVHRELSGVPDGTPETIVGADGKTYSAVRPRDEGKPDPLRDLGEALAKKFGWPDPNPELEAIIAEKRAEHVDEDRCRGLARLSDADFESVVAELAPPDDLDDDVVIVLRLKELTLKAERRMGQLLIRDEEGVK